MTRIAHATVALVFAGGSAVGMVHAEGEIVAGFFPLHDPAISLPSHGRAVSADGSIVIGDVNFVSFRWTAATGLTLIDPPPGYDGFAASGLSADGTVIVGRSSSSSDSSWLASALTPTELIVLGDLGGGIVPSSTAFAASSDGSVIVGDAPSKASGPDAAEAFIWTARSGIVGLGGFISASGLLASWTSSVSDDGTVVVGQVWISGTLQAYRWTEATDFVPLGGLESPPASNALGVSPDGNVVVGRSTGPGAGSRAFRWTAADGMVDLGNLPVSVGSPWYEATDASQDGAVIVGSVGGEAAFIWDTKHEMRNLKIVLEDVYGFDLTGWKLKSAKAVSHDGTVIVGDADSDEVFGSIAYRIGLPPLQSSDLNDDGVVDGVDLAMLLGQWTGAATYSPCPTVLDADTNSDCKVNGFDLALLLGAWG